MNIIKRIFHKHNWETFMDNIAGETGTTFTIACRQCAECGKYKIEFIYGSGKRLRNRLEPQVMPKNYDLMLSGVDEEIRDLVDVLNKNGYKTVASCSGHGKMIGNIALADGRELMIVEKFNKARLIEKVLIEKGLYKPISK